MATVSVVPLISSAQEFSITLSGVVYNMRCYWNSQPNAGWCLDINDANNSPIVQGIPLTTGQDLLFQYEYLGLGGNLLILSQGDPDLVPTYASLGVTSFLYWVTNP